MGTRDLPDMYARSPRAYISGKSRVHMLQVMLNKNTLGVKKVRGQSEAALQIGMYDQKR